jgi:hypothetical protein
MACCSEQPTFQDDRGYVLYTIVIFHGCSAALSFYDTRHSDQIPRNPDRRTIMGLDVAFNRQAAINAGLQFKDLPNGDDADISFHQTMIDNEHVAADPEHLAWLKETTTCIQVPGQEFFVADDGGAGEDVVVRANKWGRTYLPLTTWLKAKGIEWTEF